MPEASPASVGATPLIAESRIGLKPIPAPRPTARIAGQDVDEEVAVDRASRTRSSRPTAMSESPTTSGILIPNRITSRSERKSDEPPQITHRGQVREPDLERACSSSTCCRYSAEMKNHANMPPAIRTPTTFAVETFRIRKIDERHQRRRDARLDREEHAEQHRGRTPSKPSVWSEVQPSSLPLTIAYTASISAAVTVTAPATSTAVPSRRPNAAGTSRERQEKTPIPTGHVDEEDPVPARARSVRMPPSSTPIDAASRGDEAEDPHRLRALGRIGEEGHHQRERHRRDDGAAGALHRASDDEDALRGGEAARHRGEREERDPAEEEPAVAEEVAESAAEQEEPAEGEQVAVHDPRERLLGEPQVVADRGQRHADDRHVEHDHQVPQAEDDECQPACACVGHGHLGVLSFRRLALSTTRAVGTHRWQPSRVPTPFGLRSGVGFLRGTGDRTPTDESERRAVYRAMATTEPRPSRSPSTGRSGGTTCRGSAPRIGGLLARERGRRRVLRRDGIAPDAVTVDALARLQLAARRFGCPVRLRNASPELLRLVAFMGLEDVLPE